MKKTAAGLAAILLGCLMVAGCTQAPAQPSATPMPTQDTTHKEYQNYMTMTTLKYPASWAVSYTHLDVYKRQWYTCARKNEGIMPRCLRAGS